MKNLLFAPILVLAAACGSSPTAANPTTSATASASSTRAPSAAASASAATVSDACSLVAKSDAETVVGTVSDQPTATSATIPGSSANGAACAYRGSDGLLTVGLLQRAVTRTDFDTMARQVPGVQAVSGIGDAAYLASAGGTGASGASILVLKGSTYFTIVATSSSRTSDALAMSLKTLAQKAVTKV